MGDVVQISLHPELSTKVDGRGLLAVVVELLPSGQVRCAYKAGLLKHSYTRHKVTVPKGHKNNRKLIDGLEHAFQNWQGMTKLSEKAAKTAVSVATSLDITCNCKGQCVTKKCPCRKAERLCNSRCHKANSTCKNHEQPNYFVVMGR